MLFTNFINIMYCHNKIKLVAKWENGGEQNNVYLGLLYEQRKLWRSLLKS